MSEPVVRIPVDELRRVFELLVAHAAGKSATELPVDRDYFWSIPNPERYDVYNEPSELTIGQVSESCSRRPAER